MSVQGNSLFVPSVAGLTESIKTQGAELEIKKSDYRLKDRPLDVFYNISQLEKNQPKQMYYRMANPKLREIECIGKAVTQCWDTSSVWKSDNPTDDDLAVYQYELLFQEMANLVCAAEGLNPDNFKIKFTSVDEDKLEIAYFEVPTNNFPNKKTTAAKEDNEWDFPKWLHSPGIPTFKIKHIRVVRAGSLANGIRSEPQIFFKFALGRNKWILNPKKKASGKKRKLTQEEADAQDAAAAAVGAAVVDGETGEVTVKKRKLSKAAQAKLDALVKTQADENARLASLAVMTAASEVLAECDLPDEVDDVVASL